MAIAHRITPCLWFDSQAEEAATYYVGIFPNSRIRNTSRYGEAGQEVHHRPPGSVMTVDFELDGTPFTALNGGPVFSFNEAVSFQINCADQRELDYYWERLTADGDPKARQCGWLKGKFGVSWQVVPAALAGMFRDPKNPGTQRAMQALLKMKKIDIGELERAFAERTGHATDLVAGTALSAEVTHLGRRGDTVL